MRELEASEQDLVSGGGFWADFGDALDNPFRTFGQLLDRYPEFVDALGNSGWPSYSYGKLGYD